MHPPATPPPVGAKKSQPPPPPPKTDDDGMREAVAVYARLMRKHHAALAAHAQRQIDAIDALPDLHDASGNIIPRSDAFGDFDERYLSAARSLPDAAPPPEFGDGTPARALAPSLAPHDGSDDDDSFAAGSS